MAFKYLHLIFYFFIKLIYDSELPIASIVSFSYQNDCVKSVKHNTKEINISKKI